MSSEVQWVILVSKHEEQPHCSKQKVSIRKRGGEKIWRSCSTKAAGLYLPCWVERNRNVEDVRRQLFYYLYNSSGKAGAKILIQYTQIHSSLCTQRIKISTLNNCSHYSFKIWHIPWCFLDGTPWNSSRYELSIWQLVFWKYRQDSTVRSEVLVLCVIYTVVIKYINGSDPHARPLKMPRLCSL